MQLFNPRIAIILVFLSCFILGCEKEVQIDLPEHKTQPVLNCLFSQDSIFKVHLSKTVSIVNNFSSKISDATVHLYENELFIEELTFDGNIYTSTILPKTNIKYQIKVNTPKFQNITAFDYTPSKPNFISTSYQENVYTDEEGYDMSQLTIEFQDNPNKKNYYEVVFYAKEETSIPFVPYFDEKNNDPVLLNEELLKLAPEILVFSDELFNGTTYKLKINYSSIEDNLGLKIYFRHITENYYNYKKRLIIHLYNQEHDIWEGVGEPVTMYTNIEGGYGIFAGYSEITKLLKNN